ncbi:nuclear pore complex protein [Rhizodiscina lignyota]|uniref:Nuclear pore complex protein n=1 Tax=Rhizodiscina lignyota TaxID=1504668 RepID=A0A9P4M602_9PEZI|nr:nuclear pore complex protein [Rhizodiscina lignyota]
MSLPPVTPQRPLPGNFIQTPAPSRATASQPPVFGASGSAIQQNGGPVGPAPSQSQSQVNGVGGSSSATLASRAARTVNEMLAVDARYPDLDTYIIQGISSDYDISTSPSGAMAPFQRMKTYALPDKIFEQYNQAQVHTMMGLFAELHHAWLSIDNALYLWDYTAPDPQLIGFEEQPNSIMSVKLVKPREGVFIKEITHMIVVATTSDILLIGLATEKAASGVVTVRLYQTKMQASIKGIDATCVAGSDKTGRIFFAGRSSNDVYELTYQQEEKWFANRCGRVNHTSKGLTSVMPTITFGTRGPPEAVTQIIVDDTRNLVYTLSNQSTIRVFHMATSSTLNLVITRTLSNVISNVMHMVRNSELFRPGVGIVSISPISAREASRLNLMATTNTGCRIFLSATSGTYFSTDSTSAPSSMQVHHVKFPPSEHKSRAGSPKRTPSPNRIYGQNQLVDTNSRYLTGTQSSARFAPGFFFDLFNQGNNTMDNLFISAPDTGRIAGRSDTLQGAKFIETGMTLSISGIAQDIGLVTAEFSAASTPQGFGNELAVQFDKPTTEIAVLTHTGVHTIRRRRMVDIFATLLKQHKINDESLESAVNSFVRFYGRAETIATTLAVTCGQALDVSTDGARVGSLTDPEVVAAARKVFITQGGKAIVNENYALNRGESAVDTVRPSPRHEGMALYIGRLVRSVWKAPILQETATPTGGLTVNPTVPLEKLRDVQRDLTNLQEFLDQNKSFIEGLAGPEALGRVGSKQEEMALQGEHQALSSLVKLIADVIEGMAFVLVLFDNRVDEIILSLSDQARQAVRQLTFETLFTSTQGKELAKELVKAIVNRNIAAGSNVETVAEALRRKCGTFCSADDVVVFKAQEMLKKAEEAGKDTETGRRLLNESLRLFEKVAGSLRMEVLRQGIEAYVKMQFWAGSIELVLEVAKQVDRANRAGSWVKDGSPTDDPRKELYEQRKACYDLIHNIITEVDKATSAQNIPDTQLSIAQRRRSEAYSIIDNSSDELFQMNLYDWYLAQGWPDRLLEIKSPFVVSYLQHKSLEDVLHADLLWKYYTHYARYFEAATVQLQLAKSGFNLGLNARIEYLARAKANAGTKTGADSFRGLNGLSSSMGRSRQGRQEIIREINDLLELANLQEDLLSRLLRDRRLTKDKRPEIMKDLNGPIKTLDELYHQYVDQASYEDLALVIYQIGDYRNLPHVAATWESLIERDQFEQVQIYNEQAADSVQIAQPWERVGERIRTMGAKLQLSEVAFAIQVVLPLAAKYYVDQVLKGDGVLGHNRQARMPPQEWVPALFADLSVPFETMVVVLEGLFYGNEAPWNDRRNRGIVGAWIVYVVQRWFSDSLANGAAGELVFGGEENAMGVLQTLKNVEGANVLTPVTTEESRLLRARIEGALR